MKHHELKPKSEPQPNNKNFEKAAYYLASLLLERPIMTKMLRSYKSPSILDLYLHLTACSVDEGYIVIKTKELANAINKSTQTVRRLLKILDRWNIIDIYQIHGINIYVINPYLFWHTKSQKVERHRKKWDEVNKFNLSHAKNGYQQMRKLNLKYVTEYTNLRKQATKNCKYYKINKDLPEIVNQRIDKNQRKEMDFIEHPNEAAEIKMILKKDAKKDDFPPKKALVIRFIIDNIDLDTNCIELTNKAMAKHLQISYNTVTLAIQQACDLHLFQRLYDKIGIYKKKLDNICDDVEQSNND